MRTPSGAGSPFRREPMRIVFFIHSLVSCWNHGNAHFLRGVLRELRTRGHETRVFEPEGAWSRQNLVCEQGEAAIARFHAAFPGLASETYGRDIDLDAMLDGADVVIVHEWNEPRLVSALGRKRAHGRFLLLFHDTHHRAVSAETDMSGLDLEHYDGVLAFGEVLRQLYLRRGWAERAFTWHEAADTALFRPIPEISPERDLVWIGNWGDGERTAELSTFLFEPVARLGASLDVYGVRYPPEGVAAVEAVGGVFRGWLPNAQVPRAFAAHRATVHIPRRPYVEALPGIPTIRVFEALACGIPLVSAPWDDTEGLFRPGLDFLMARNGDDMAVRLGTVLRDAEARAALIRNGLETIRARHSCAHRVTELLSIVERLRTGRALASEAAE